MMEEVMMQEMRRAARTAANPTSPRTTASLAPDVQSCRCCNGKCFTVATGDGGEVVAKEDKEDDLEEGGHAVNKVPRR